MFKLLKVKPYFTIIVKYNIMLSQKREFGDLGEKIAKEYLEKLGYKLIDQNYSKRWGEIDLIFESPRLDSESKREEKELVFLEIKTREEKKFPSAFLPEDSINFAKQQKLIKTAQTFLYENKYSDDVLWRIDVIAIEIDNISRRAKIRHIKNAIEM